MNITCSVTHRSAAGRAASWLAALLLTAAFSVGAQPAPTAGDNRLGTFKSVQGEVTVTRADGRRAAVVGDGIAAMDRLVTGANSAAAVTLKDGTVISLGPDSSLELEQFQFDSTTEEGNLAVRLLRGSLRMVTGLIAKLKPENVRVITPTTVIGVRGTDFIVETQAQ